VETEDRDRTTPNPPHTNIAIIHTPRRCSQREPVKIAPGETGGGVVQNTPPSCKDGVTHAYGCLGS